MKAIDRVVEAVKSKILANIESGDLTAASQQLWLTSAKMPTNAISGKPYTNLLNALNLVFASEKKGYTSNRWLTYNQAKAKGISVRKGEKGELVIGWFQSKPKDDEDPKAKRGLFPKAFTVFNEEQLTEMLPGHMIESTPPFESSDVIATIDKVVDYIGVNRAVSKQGNYYVPATDTIHILPMSDFVGEAAAVNVLLHELSHATGSKDRFDRLSVPCRFGDQAYAVEECIAESSGFLVCMYLGLPYLEAHSSACITGWLRNNIDSLDDILVSATKASKMLIDAFVSIRNAEMEDSGFTENSAYSA